MIGIILLLGGITVLLFVLLGIVPEPEEKAWKPPVYLPETPVLTEEGDVIGYPEGGSTINPEAEVYYPSEGNKVKELSEIYTSEEIGAFHRAGDVDLDGKIWGNDLRLANMFYGCSTQDKPEAKIADLNGDGEVDAYDVQQISLNWGKTIKQAKDEGLLEYYK